MVRPIVASLFCKSVSEKGFLKAQALKAIAYLPSRWSAYALEELCIQTHAQNGTISELAIKVLSDMIQNRKEWEADGKFLKSLSGSLVGKRAVVQRKAKEILQALKKRSGEGRLEELIQGSSELLEEESNTLRKELRER